MLALDVVGHLAPYAAAKGGLWQVTRTMALELARPPSAASAPPPTSMAPRYMTGSVIVVDDGFLLA